MQAIEVKNLTFKRKERAIFNDFDVSINSGKFVALLGPNGTGKSTLLKLFCGILQGDSGDITLLGQSLSNMKQLERARIISYMPQTTHLETPFTVEQVVKMGRYPHKKRFSNWSSVDDEQVARAIEYTGITELKERFITDLSGGERQLVYLTKAIAQNTPILLLDEPTSDLDIYHQMIVTKLLRQLVQDGRTVVAAIHDINLAARICDESLLIKDGEIIVFGEQQQVMQKMNLQRGFQVKTYVYEEQFTSAVQMIPYEVGK